MVITAPTRNRLGALAPRGFEPHPLRHLHKLACDPPGCVSRLVSGSVDNIVIKFPAAPVIAEHSGMWKLKSSDTYPDAASVMSNNRLKPGVAHIPQTAMYT